MTGIFSGYTGFLLQPMQYYKTDNPVEGTIVLVGIGVIILISFLIHLVRNGIGATGPIGSRSAASAPRKFNAFTLHRIAASYGLDRDQTQLLEYVFRSSSVNDPERVLKNSALLDKHFKQVYKTIEKNAETDEEAQHRLSGLFSLRNAIESAPANSSGITSTSQIPDNMAAVLSNGKESYTVRIISAKGETLLSEIPRNALGSPVKIAKGAKITLSFFTKSSKGFSFESRVLGSVDSGQGPALELAHSGKPQPLVQRRFRRKQISAGCVFHLVLLDTAKTGRKQPPKLIVDNRRFTGNIIDISAGGCSIKTSAPVQVGSRLKIELDYSDESMIAVLGQVLRINRSGAVGTIIHIKFLKVPRRSFNNINSIVFGYDSD
ncbi:MAG: PilZ domain-containing protein [Treponema sp.]|nr:PilZ domain-containing protein [Treponema sp.]